MATVAKDNKIEIHKHTLVATGSVIHPKLDIAIYAYLLGDAMGEAKCIVAALHPAGYFRFHLFYTDNGHDALVAEFKVTQPALIVETK